MSFEDKYVVSKRGQPAGSFSAREIIDLLRMKELSTIHKVKVGDDEMTVATFIETYETGGLPEQNLGKSPEPEQKEEPEEEEEEEEAPPPPADQPPPEPGPADEIHVSREGQRFGPYLINEVKDYLKSGNLRFSDTVWYNGLNDWVSLSLVPGVSDGVETLHAAAPPPPKPPPAPTGPPQPPPTIAGGPPQVGMTQQEAVQPVFGGGEDSEDEAEALEGERQGIAGLGARAIGLLIDTLLVAAATSAVAGLVYGLHTVTNPNAKIAEWQQWTVPCVIAVIVGWLYSSLTESSGGMATLGKRIVKTQVCVEETGGRIGFGLASARAFSKIPGVIGFFFIFMSRRRQTLHDMMLGTIVRQRIESADHDFDDEEYDDEE